MDCENKGGEFRVAGPPGCGKTTWLSRQIENAAIKYGSDAIFVSSFTKAAAVELVNRNLPIHNSSVGTLHSHCYRAIGEPTIAELHIDDFNKDFPQYTMSASGKQKLDEAAADTASGDSESDNLFSRYNIYRNKMIPRDQWTSDVVGFSKVWEEFKTSNDLYDFTDLIEISYRDFYCAPNNPIIGFIDETQDLTPLQYALVRKWGESMKYFILVGDCDQLLYDFCGATVEPFLTPIPLDKKIVLKQSFRVPIKPHALALKWIRRCKRREDVEYFPTAVIGSVHKNPGTYKEPAPIIDAAEIDVDSGHTVMILANCAYQLQPVIAELRRRGLPYHNPYRESRGDWNPLARRKGWTASDRLLAYLEPQGPEYYGPALGPIQRYWTPTQLNAWVALCTAKGLLEHGAKERIKEVVSKNESMSDAAIGDFVLDTIDINVLPEALRLDHKWLEDHLSAANRKRLDFPINIMKQRGRDALRDAPKIIVGTVHSVKGGEASCCYVIPDVSLASWKNACASDVGRDALIRQGYVAFTRCSEKLTLCKPATAYHMGRI